MKRTKKELLDVLNSTKSQSEAGRKLGVCRQRVAAMIKQHGIQVKRVEKYVPVNYTYKVKKVIATYF